MGQMGGSGQNNQMGTVQHRKSSSTSPGNAAAVMSGKQQIGGQGSSGNGGYGNIKFVKPSELSLDLIAPNNLRNMGIKGNHGTL